MSVTVAVAVGDFSEVKKLVDCWWRTLALKEVL